VKRTPLRRKIGFHAKTPLARTAGPTRRTRLAKGRGKGRKCYAYLRDEQYKVWVRLQPCLLADVDGHVCKGRVEFSHIANEGNGGADFANGLPLCSHAAHRFGSKCWHVMGRDSWQAYWEIDAVASAEWLARKYTHDLLSDSAGERTQ